MKDNTINNVFNKKIYSYCLASVVTGGCELIHQMVDFLNNHGCDAYVVYVGKGSHEIPEPYSKYNIKVNLIFISHEHTAFPVFSL